MDIVAEQGQETSVEELIKRFESDMAHDCHSYALRFGRSQARKELVRRGKEALRPIADHLRTHSPGSDMNLDTAWGHLLSMIDANLLRDGPMLLRDMRGWIEWAERTLAE